MSLLAGPKPEENCHPAPSPSCIHPETPSFVSLWEQTRDLTYITVESGGRWGEACSCVWLQWVWLGYGVAAQDLCFSGGRCVGSWAWAGGEAAVQGDALQSRWVHAPRAREVPRP